jgi:hypothetical protein
MLHITRVKGTTSLILQIFIRDLSDNSGLGKSGLAHNTASLTAYYKRNTAAAPVAITLVTATLGTFASGGFKEIDATNMIGAYELHIPNAALITGADNVLVCLQGAADMTPVQVMIDLVGWDPQDAVRGGLSALPAGPFRLKKNTAYANFTFVMTDSTNHLPLTGAAVAAQRSIDGAAFASCANSVTEVGSGVYKISLAAADLNGDNVMLKFSASGADTRFLGIVTQE